MTDKTKETRNYGSIPEMKWIDIELLRINEKYQRDTRGTRSRNNIEKIMQNFNWADFTPITVSKEECGFYSIIDGQHRYEAAVTLGDILQLPCWIVNANTKKQAETFIDINKNRVAVTPYAIYKASLASGDYGAARIENFCNSAGIIIPYNGFCSKPNMTLAIATIKKHLERHNDGYLLAAFHVIREAFPNKNNQMKAEIVNMLVDLKIEYGDRIKNDELIVALRSFEGVDKISAKARELKALDASLSSKEAHKRIFVSKIKELRRVK